MHVQNVGWRDAGVRALVAGLLLLTAAAIPEHPLIALGVGFIGIVLTGTALFRVCPLYTLLRINTCSRPEIRAN